MVFKVKTWDHILLEGYCMINVDYLHKHSKWVYGFSANEKAENRGKRPNPDYDPSAKPDKQPEYCKSKVSIDCMRGGKFCPHLAYGSPEKPIQTRFKKMIKEYYTD